MYRYLLLFLIITIGFCSGAMAQVTLRGRVFELHTHIHLQSIRVTNLNTKQFTVTDTAGLFYISAAIGDKLQIRGYAYKTDTLIIIDKNTLEIHLEPDGKMLNQVNITSNDAKLGSMHAPDLNGQAVVYQRDEKGYDKGGIDIRFGYGKDKKKVHDKKLTDEEAADEEIDQAFSLQNLAKSIPLTGQDLKNFAAMYRPDRATFKAPDFNLTVYLNDCYKKYRALPPDKRKPTKLTTDTLKH